MALYQSLSVDDNEIRLLKLHSGVADDPLRCTLLQVSLHLHYKYEYRDWGTDHESFTPGVELEPCDDHHPPYEALSYEWGAEPYESPICHVLRTGIYIASSPPLGHHHSYIFIPIHTTFPLPQLVQAVALSQSMTFLGKYPRTSLQLCTSSDTLIEIEYYGPMLYALTRWTAMKRTAKFLS
jgi:hypothetical protein